MLSLFSMFVIFYACKWLKHFFKGYSIKSNVTICGGFLITHVHILTTEHCARTLKKSNLAIKTFLQLDDEDEEEFESSPGIAIKDLHFFEKVR